MNVRTTDKADEHIGAIDAWWRTNRLSAPALFADELPGAFDILSVFPNAGPPYRPRAGVRRFLLRATRHHVYYVIDGAGVLVIAVWGAVRGRAPRLQRPD